MILLQNTDDFNGSEQVWDAKSAFRQKGQF